MTANWCASSRRANGGCGHEQLAPIFRAGAGAGRRRLIGCHRQAAPAPAGDSLTVALSTNAIRVGDLIRLRLTAVHGTNVHLNPPELGQGKDILVRARRDARRAAARRPRPRGARLRHHLARHRPAHPRHQPRRRLDAADGTTTQTPLPFAAFKVQSTLTSTNADLSQVRDLHDLARWPDRFPRWLLAAADRRRGRRPWRMAAAPLPGPRPRGGRTGAAHSAAHRRARGAARPARARPDRASTRSSPSTWSSRPSRGATSKRASPCTRPSRPPRNFCAPPPSSGSISPGHQQLVANFLEQSDLVKFARFQPGQDDMRAAYAAAEKLVQETIPAPVGQPTAAAQTPVERTLPNANGTHD